MAIAINILRSFAGNGNEHLAPVSDRGRFRNDRCTIKSYRRNLGNERCTPFSGYPETGYNRCAIFFLRRKTEYKRCTVKFCHRKLGYNAKNSKSCEKKVGTPRCTLFPDATEQGVQRCCTSFSRRNSSAKCVLPDFLQRKEGTTPLYPLFW